MAPDLLVLGGALLTGLLGSAHCAAMCGGIATSLSLQQRGGWWVALQPNLGRVAGYALGGALAGGAGSAMIDLSRMPWLVPASRAAVGIVLILAALRLLDRSGRFAFLHARGAAAWRFLRPLHRRLLPADTLGKRLASGMLWGWMPCGLSTHLLLAAWLQADAVHGAATMAAFGIATLPVMWPLAWSGQRLGQRLQRGHWRTASASCVMAAGVVTLAAPWLMHAPVLHGALAALGCRGVA